MFNLKNIDEISPKRILSGFHVYSRRWTDAIDEHTGKKNEVTAETSKTPKKPIGKQE